MHKIDPNPPELRIKKSINYKSGKFLYLQYSRYITRAAHEREELLLEPREPCETLESSFEHVGVFLETSETRSVL
ncbi:hypothetical protein M9434_001610 [Picochlorum sp. BPE23]|nr:hypothetical protein M9434_001610 [Picochlorum sp. BPE23]KAI8110325.1 hypothetical protein M9435_002001 [Picochlorum sp. BPE23]